MKSFLRQIEESFTSLEEKQKRWQDSDGDGKWYEPGQDVKAEAAKPDYLDFDGDGDKEEPMVNALEDVEQCTKCKGKGCEHCDGKGYHEKVDEMSTTAGVAPVTTPYAFSKDKKQKKKIKYPGVAEAMEKRYERLIEGYGQYVTCRS